MTSNGISADLKDLSAQLSVAEVEVRTILKTVAELKGKLSSLQFETFTSKEYNEVVSKNTKLKHRLVILKRSIEEERSRGGNMAAAVDPNSGIQKALSEIFEVAVHAAYPDIVDMEFPVVPATNAKFGDYQLNGAMAISNILKNQGIKVPPFEIAQKIANNIPSNSLISNTEIAKPGFINIWLDQKYCVERLVQIIINGVDPPRIPKKERIVVDFSSPNIAKQMHVGHLRSTIIGESISRLLEFLGHDVLRINHVGDWGTQFGMLIAHLQDMFPNYMSVSPPIEDLQSFYKEAKKRFDEDEDFKSRAYSCVVKLQGGHSDYISAWKLICEVSRKEFQQIYDKLGITLTERGESFYQSQMLEVVEELQVGGFLEEDDGRKVMWGLEEGSIPLTIVKSDGGFTYDTSDMACIKYRIQQDRASWIIYVTDMGQATHFKVLFSCAERAGILNRSKVRVDHVGFGVVLGEDKKKFKTRSGDTVRLNDLLEEGVKRSWEKLHEKNRDAVLTEKELDEAKHAVAYGCIKYADLMHNRTCDYIFSFDKMLEDKGNTAVYLLYALTRIRSIARNANISQEQIKKYGKTEQLSFSHEKEWKLVKTLLKFNDIILKVSQSLFLHHLCEYLYEVAITFTEFYDNCYCIEKDKSGSIIKVHMDRLVLCESTALVMEKCFFLLGLNTVSKM